EARRPLAGRSRPAPASRPLRPPRTGRRNLVPDPDLVPSARDDGAGAHRGGFARDGNDGGAASGGVGEGEIAPTRRAQRGGAAEAAQRPARPRRRVVHRPPAARHREGVRLPLPRGRDGNLQRRHRSAHLRTEPQAIRATIGLPLTVAFSGLLGLAEGSPEVEEVVQEYRRLWRANVVPRSADLLYRGVAEGVQVLRDLGLRLAVATSKIRSGAL